MKKPSCFASHSSTLQPTGAREDTEWQPVAAARKLQNISQRSTSRHMQDYQHVPRHQWYGSISKSKWRKFRKDTNSTSFCYHVGVEDLWFFTQLSFLLRIFHHFLSHQPETPASVQQPRCQVILCRSTACGGQDQQRPWWRCCKIRGSLWEWYCWWLKSYTTWDGAETL